MDADEHITPIDLLSSKERLVAKVISELPVLDKDSIPLDDSCPICLTSFASLIAEDQDGNVGVTKLNGCGHIFCMKECVISCSPTLEGCSTRYSQLDRVDTEFRKYHLCELCSYIYDISTSHQARELSHMPTHFP